MKRFFASLKVTLRASLHYLQSPYVYWPLLIVSALLTPLAFAPYRHAFLMPLLLAFMFHVVETRTRHRVKAAYVWGVVAYTAQFYWINTALHDVAGMSQVLALPLTLLLPLYLALYPALTFWLLGKIRVGVVARLTLFLPPLWTLSEYVREHAFTGFGWGALGYSQVAASPLAGFAPVGGIHLVTLAVVWVAALLLSVKLARCWRLRTGLLVVLAAIIVVGTLLKTVNFTHPNGSSASVVLVQGNIEQSIKFNSDQVIPTLQRYYDLIAESHADITLLPETAIPVLREDLPRGVLEQFADQATRNGSALAVGIVQYTDSSRKSYQNAVLDLSHYDADAPEKSSYYAKSHLVPFGEYIPLENITAWLYRYMNIPLSGFSPGPSVQKPLLLSNQQVAFNICYEDGFGDELIASAKTSSLLANVSNMAWYGKSNAMDQQLQQSQARALELGRYMIRATNTGMTAIIDPKGRIDALLPPDVAQNLYGTIEGYEGWTPYMKMGSSRPLMVALLLWLLGFYTFFWWRKKRAGSVSC